MKKATVAIVIGLFLVTTVMAQTLPKATIKQIGFLGKGLAISESDPKDTHEIKIGIATVTVNLTTQGTTQSTDVSAGILYFDNVKYKLKTLTVENKTASGDIYLNDSQVGTFEVALVSKPKVDLWSGSITLNGVNYNLYVLEGKRTMKAVELGDKVSEYCQAHHANENCRDKIGEYCEKNPDDARCVGLLNNYCRAHGEDGRCRQRLREFCKNTPTSEQCSEYCEDHPLVCGIKATKCTDCPDGYRPTDDGFCALNCRKGRKSCQSEIINCPSTTTTTTTTATTSTTTGTTTTTSATTTSTTTTTTETTTTTPTTTTTTETTTTSATTTTTGTGG